MGMSAFTQHDAESPPLVLDSQQATLLELLSAAGGGPVSYGELQEAGVGSPARVVAGLELAGVPIVRCFLGEEREVGVRFELPLDARCAPTHSAKAVSPATSLLGGERPRDRLTHVSWTVADRGCAAVTALLAWIVCNGPPVTRYTVRWLLFTGRIVGHRAHRTARRALSGGARCARDAAVAVVAWLARVVPPAKGVAARGSSRVACVVRERAASGAVSAKYHGRAALGALTRTAASASSGVRAGGRWLVGESHVLAERLRGSTTMRSVARRASRGDPITHSQHVSSAHPLGPSRDSAAFLNQWASCQTRNRCLAFSALMVVAGVVLVLVISNLGASAGGARRFEAPRHSSRLASPPSTARGAQSTRTTKAAE
jgi:hypothetical protein